MQEEECKKQKSGAPDWMVTFSDLMTLLLTFFVLLLSMANMDSVRIESGTESIREAFNGQELIGEDIKEFVPVQSPIKQIKIDKESKVKPKSKDEGDTEEEDLLKENPIYTELQKMNMTRTQAEQLGDKIRSDAEDVIKQQDMEIVVTPESVLIRFPEKPAFASGSADLTPRMEKVITQLASTIKNYDVEMVISGYTDDRPINTARFRSNWDLSSARATSVTHILESIGKFKPEQIKSVGHAHGHPLVPNNTASNRAKNRRVEIMIDVKNDPATKNMLGGQVESGDKKVATQKKDSVNSKANTKKKTAPATKTPKAPEEKTAKPKQAPRDNTTNKATNK